MLEYKGTTEINGQTYSVYESTGEPPQVAMDPENSLLKKGVSQGLGIAIHKLRSDGVFLPVVVGEKQDLIARYALAMAAELENIRRECYNVNQSEVSVGGKTPPNSYNVKPSVLDAPWSDPY